MTTKEEKDFINILDVSSLKKRREAVLLVIELLEKVRLAEIKVLVMTPQNLRGTDTYAATEESNEVIYYVIKSLKDAYLLF